MPTPAQMRDRYREIAYRYRDIPAQHGLRMYTVAIVASAWSGNHVGDGAETTAETAIVENNGNPPKVRWLTAKQLAMTGAAAGTIEIGPITPDHSGGGTALSNFDGTAQANGETLHVKITGPRCPDGSLYEVTEIRADKALHWTITAAPVGSS